MLVATLLLAACGSTPPRAKLTVFAASSLAAALQEVAAGFEDAHPDVDVVLSLAGSQTLATQIAGGAEPDVFASADEAQMERAVEARPADPGPVVFARNRLVIAVAPGNPRSVDSVADLARPDLVVVLGAPEVPVGRYGHQVLAAAGVEANVASYESDVGLVLTKVRLGEADAGLVYASDLTRAGGEVEGVEIPAEVNVVASYPIVAWGDGTPREFVQFVTSGPGQAHLREAGFDT